MRFIAVLSSLLTFILHVFAGGKCLTKADADELVTNFISLTNGNAFDVALARALIAPDVVDTSGSVASIINSGKLEHPWGTCTELFRLFQTYCLHTCR